MALVEERRRAVLRAVVAFAPAPVMLGQGVLPFHVRFFGVPECVTDQSVERISADLRWLERHGYVRRVGDRAPIRFVPTEEGEGWIR